MQWKATEFGVAGKNRKWAFQRALAQEKWCTHFHVIGYESQPIFTHGARTKKTKNTSFSKLASNETKRSSKSSKSASESP